MASAVHVTMEMSIGSDAPEVQSLQLKLSFASDPETGAYEVTIEFCEIDVAVEVLDLDLRRAIRTAAARCAEQLSDRGYAVTSADVIGALEDALEHSKFGHPRATPAQYLN